MDWVSGGHTDFNYDFGVSFTAEQQRNGAEYNYAQDPHPFADREGLSVFTLNDGVIYHTYSTFARGIDQLNVAYQILDLVPRGRNEEGHDFPQYWVRRHDEY